MCVYLCMQLRLYEQFCSLSTGSEPGQVSKRLLAGQNLLLLKEHYHENPYPSETEIKEIANQLKVGVDKVKKWFYNQQRMAFKKGEHFDIQNRRVIIGRRRFTSEQYLILKKAYESSSGKIPDSKGMENLAIELKVKDLKQIKNWFQAQQTRRAKCKKSN